MRLPKPKRIVAEKYVAGLSLFKQKVAKTVKIQRTVYIYKILSLYRTYDLAKTLTF